MSHMKPELDHATMAKAFFGSHHPLFNAFGIEVATVADAKAEMTMPFSEMLADSRGALHRGTLVTLLDTTCGLAIFSALRSLRPIATIDLRIDYLRAVPPGSGLRAVVECIGWTDSVAFITGRGYAPGDEMPLATVTGSFAINTLGPAFDSTARSAA
ncbi:MAG TPA: PaaI family thioesterase [Anaerolineales bacterium]|mgnify:CR=1 FL=1|nr:PaaI family thioesterase [Anaerolineales bacterium]